MPKLNNIDWYALIDTLLGQLKIEYELKVTDNHITIKTPPLHYQAVQEQLNTALNSVSSVLPYSVEVAPLQETVPEALLHFKALLGQERFNDIAFDPNELFNEQKGSTISGGVLYSKPTSNKRTIAVWKDAVNALVADLSSHSREQLKALWDNQTPIARDKHADSQDEINYHDIVKQNFGLYKDNNQATRVFFNFRQLWQDLFVAELAVKSRVIQAPKIKGSRKNAELVLSKAQLLDYLRQELQSDVLWRVFQSDQGPVATPLFLDTSHQVDRKTKVSIIIDRSSSMGNMFDTLTSNILAFIKQLEANTQVNILFFDHEIEPRKKFRAGDTKAIAAYVKSLQPRGSTYLYKALDKEFIDLLKESSSLDNTAVLLLTDGQDATPNSAATISNILQTQQKFVHAGVKVPKIFTVGIGNEGQIQKLDPRIANERLIINTVAEFDQVFKYIHEIQYPLIEHTLVVTQKPGQNDQYKVTYPQDTNVQSPDIYVSFNHGAIGVIGNHHKQIIRLNGKHSNSNIRDLVKGILVKTRERMTSKSNSVKEQLAFIKGHVLKLIEQSVAPYDKATLEKLSDILEHSQHESLEEVELQTRYVKQAASKTLFSMEYDSSKELALPGTSYNVAGKLNSGVQEPIPPTPATAGLKTKVNSQQNQMTLQTLDHTQTELRRLYADCVPMMGAFNEAPFLYCQADGWSAQVFPKEGTFSHHGDHYNLRSCRPIFFYDQPSVTCEGEASSVVITPHDPVRPFESLSANIALGAVLLNWCKKAYDWVTRSSVKSTNQFVTDGDIFNRKIKKLRNFLNVTQNKVNKTHGLDSAQFYLSEIEDFQDEAKTLERQFLKGTLDKGQFDEFYDEVKTYKEEIFGLCDSHLIQPHNRLMTHQFTLERQRDWGQLIEVNPVARLQRCVPS